MYDFDRIRSDNDLITIAEQAGAEEVLQPLPQARAAQGNQVTAASGVAAARRSGVRGARKVCAGQ